MHAVPTARQRRCARWLPILLSVLMASGLSLGSAAPQARAEALRAAAAATQNTGIAGSVAVPSGSEWVAINVYSVVDGVEHLAGDAWTSGSGAFDIRYLAEGSYIVRFVSAAYRSRCYGGDPCVPVVVTEGQVTQLGENSLELRGPGSVVGLVRDTTNAPVVGAAVTATRGDELITATSDGEGRFRIDNLAAGVEWQILAAKPGYVSQADWTQPKEGRTTDVGTLRLFRPGTISGRVSGDDGLPLSGAWVSLESTDGWAGATATTDQNGDFIFTGLAPDRYSLWASAPWGYLGGYAPDGGGSADGGALGLHEGTDATMNVTLARPATITGSVTGTNGTPRHGTAYLYDENGDWQAASGFEGDYGFDWLRPGRYTVMVEVNGERRWLGGGQSLADATWLTMASGQASNGNDIVVSTAGLPTTVNVSLADADGQPFEADVYLTGYVGWTGDNDEFSGSSDPDGHLQLSVNPGEYTVSVQRDGTIICGSDRTVTCSPSSVTALDGGSVALDLTMPRLGSLSGSVTGPGGAVLSWGELDLRDASGSNVADPDFDGTGTGYRIGSLPYGTYTATIYSEEYLEKTAPVVIDGDATLDVELAPGWAVSGAITVPTNSGDVDDIRVSVVDKATGMVVDTEWASPEDGRATYRVAGLRNGEYLVGIGTGEANWRWYPDTTNVADAETVRVDGADVTGIDFSLAPTVAGVRVSGRVVLPEGVSVVDEYPEVSFANVDTGEQYDPVVDGSGAYAASVPPGDYHVAVEQSPGLGTVSLNEELTVTSDMTYDLVLHVGGTLIGRLVGADGLGVRGWLHVLAGNEEVGYADTDRWGYWSAGALPAGPVTLKVWPEDGDLAETDFPGYTVVTGATVDTGTQMVPAVGWLRVRMPVLHTSDAEEDDYYVVRVTDPDGHVLTTERAWGGDNERIPVRAGEVKVRFSGPTIRTEWWKDADSVASATTLTVRAGRVGPLLEPTLQQPEAGSGGTIAGTVTNATGKAGSLSLTVFSDDGAAQTVMPAMDGSFSVEVQPGDYTVRASLCTGLWMGPSGCMGKRVVTWFGGSSQWTATVVTVGEGSTVADIDVAVGGSPRYTLSPKPEVEGTAAFGSTLTANAGTWTPRPDVLGYQWLRDGVAIVGATGTTYLLGVDDLDAAISVTVTATKAGYDPASRTSEPTARIVAGTFTAPTPTLSGTAAVGSSLRVLPGAWTPTPTGLSFRWLRNGAAINGATGEFYTIMAEDVGAKLAAEVTGTRPGYTALTVATPETAAVPGTPMTTAPTPTISGTAKVGYTLTARPGTWNPSATFSYQWRRGTEAVGTDAPTYRLVGEDYGKTITVTVTGSAPGYAPVARTSKPTAKVAAGALSTTTPVVGGVARVAETMSVKPLAWGPGTVDLTYQWYKVSSRGKSYKLTTASARTASYAIQGTDAGYRLKVTVTGTEAGYATKSVSSKATGYVAKAVFGSVAVPTVTFDGTTPRVGKKLTATPGDATPAVSTGWSYQWYRVKPSTGKASSISKATKSAYVLTSADRGYQVRVRVTTTLTGYVSVRKESTPTAVVEAGLAGVTPRLSDTTPVVDQVVAVTPATLPDAWPQAVTPTYRWFVGGAEVAGNDQATYRVRAGDVGKRIAVTVVGAASDYAPLARTSSSSSKVAAANFLAKGTATVAAVGSVLTATTSGWSPDPDRFSYQWFRNGSAIAKATAASYDRGTSTGTFTVRVTAIRAGYVSASVTSVALKV